MKDIRDKCTYKNRLYQSRLDVRWAVYFSLVGWTAEYQPMEINGWTPDFLIHGDQPMLVAVNPSGKFEAVLGKRFSELAIAAGLSHDILVVGPGPVGKLKHWDKTQSLGLLGEYVSAEHAAEGRPLHVFESAAIGQWVPDRLGVCHSLMSYTDRISGSHNGTIPDTPAWASEMFDHTWGIADACPKVTS